MGERGGRAGEAIPAEHHLAVPGQEDGRGLEPQVQHIVRAAALARPAVQRLKTVADLRCQVEEDVVGDALTVGATPIQHPLQVHPVHPVLDDVAISSIRHPVEHLNKERMADPQQVTDAGLGRSQPGGIAKYVRQDASNHHLASALRIEGSLVALCHPPGAKLLSQGEWPDGLGKEQHGGFLGYPGVQGARAPNKPHYRAQAPTARSSQTGSTAHCRPIGTRLADPPTGLLGPGPPRPTPPSSGLNP